MEELFLFNRLLSKDKLFNDKYDKKYFRVKQKNINNYNRYLKRPIIYSILNYKYRHLII